MGLVAGVITTAMVLATTLSITNVSATTSNENNDWGNLASDLAKSGKMGEHASDPDHDDIKGHDEGPRQGVGNLDLDGDGEKDHPSETADTLRGLCDSLPDDDPRCP
jgi:hypothetical protein